MAGNVTVPGGDGTVWTDVSDLLSKACEELGKGELIYGENFSMDNGKYNSMDEAIESGTAPIPLSPDKTMDVLCVIDVMDHFLSCEATWHKGHSLAQTLFSCFYLLRLDGTSSHPLLHSYCRVVRATCNAVISHVSEAHVKPLQPNLDLEEGSPKGKLERIRASSEFLTSVASTSNSDGGPVRTTASGCHPIGFDPNLNLRSSAPAPPRAIKKLSWEEALEYFVKLLYDLDTVCSFPLDLSLENILCLIVQFQKSQPDLVARAHLQLLLVLGEALWTAASLPISLKDHDIQKNEAVVQSGQPEMAVEKEFGEFSNTSNDEMLAALRNDRKAFLCSGPFNTEHERFLQHFEHLQKACLPDNITYISFKECTARASLSGVITSNHFKDAQRIVVELNNSFANGPDRMSELRQIELIAECKSMALNIIGRVGSVDPTLKVSFEFMLHPASAVAIVKRS
ncbi:N-alpha-acetyltransferase 35, NatC auxiliary subunit-like protein [Drosera capensis]